MSERRKLTDLELDLLRYISEHQSASVREVADHFAQTNGHVRTTTLNIMERLRKKGYLKRRKAGGIYQYWPTLSEPAMLRNLVRGFVQKTLAGSVSPFVAYLAEEAKISPSELAELKQIIRELEKQKDKK
jgi:predicted transcriptional regulator